MTSLLRFIDLMERVVSYSGVVGDNVVVRATSQNTTFYVNDVYAEKGVLWIEIEEIVPTLVA